MRELTVNLGDRSYPIFIGANLLNQVELYARYFCGEQVLVVTNENLWLPYGENFVAGLAKSLNKVDSVVLPDGEQYKTLAVLNNIFDALLENKYNRRTTLVALGGGVVGDMTGFAASAYQRGVGFIQIPTTLLAQVDSSVGGKTGVNHPLGKNMIGAFYQPQCVVIDTEVLSTLPERELSAGLAEVIKYGLIADSEFFSWLEANMLRLMARERDALIYAIERSCQIKAEVVAQDEKEAGLRAILNLGHTFGHAIEASQGYGQWLHGEAVAAGTVMACELSQRLGWLDATVVERSVALFNMANLPVKPPADMCPETFMKYMAVDKKVLHGTLRLVLLKGLGTAVVTSEFERDCLMQVLRGVA
ncbi:MAG: 3-dehydroquinate synthase [Cellvibrionaceae bacterium]|nr:3-dehydroquinate synthase [Cellvibrionaceae bacterium]